MALCLHAHAEAAGPAALVTAFGDQTRQMLKDARLGSAERQRRIHVLVDENFDFPFIARFVLGRYWQATADDVRRDFARVFEDYVIEGYAGRINEYGRQPAAVTSERSEGEHLTVVATKFTNANGDAPTIVEWRVQATTGGLKITDISVSGVSMAISFREQFAAVIQQNDGKVSGLISELRGKLGATPAEAASAQ